MSQAIQRRAYQVEDRATVEPLRGPAPHVIGEDAVRGADGDIGASEVTEPDPEPLLLLELAQVDDHREAGEGAAVVSSVAIR